MVLHLMGNIDEDDYHVSPGNEFFDCGDEHFEELMCVQPQQRNPTDPLNTPFKKGIPLTWMLLDSQSTIDMFCNPTLLVILDQINNKLTLRCNV
mmetsp:Transcript_22953/g.41358  ORF Transcript_22953/g.41358 Transcript_22953/m.41358 type:complete len:94 (+) Transcript_22953:923-1204(+)